VHASGSPFLMSPMVRIPAAMARSPHRRSPDQNAVLQLLPQNRCGEPPSRGRNGCPHHWPTAEALHGRYPNPDQSRGFEDAGSLPKLGADLLYLATVYLRAANRLSAFGAHLSGPAQSSVYALLDDGALIEVDTNSVQLAWLRSEGFAWPGPTLAHLRMAVLLGLSPRPYLSLLSL
jgi:hypothetical protein